MSINVNARKLWSVVVLVTNGLLQTYRTLLSLQSTFLSITNGEYINKHAAAAAKSLQSCPTLCDPIDSRPPGSPVPGVLQARTLEWVAISFSSA